MVNNIKSQLTEQQIQDLQTKWDIQSEFKTETTAWWYDYKYWQDICVRQDLPKEFEEEYEEILKKCRFLQTLPKVCPILNGVIF